MPAYPPFPERTSWTVADLEQLPEDGNRYEILHGELLVTPLPSTGHQGVAARLLLLVANWCRAHTGWRFLAPGGVYISETNGLEPDVAVYQSPEFDNRPWRELPCPLWVAEVLSPSTRSRDRHSKQAAYLTDGAIWVPDERLPALIVTTVELFGAPAP